MEPHVLCDKDRCASMHACMHARRWMGRRLRRKEPAQTAKRHRERRDTLCVICKGKDCHAGLPCRRCKDPTRPNTEVRPHLCTRTHAGTRTHTHARTHARTHTHTHTHTHTTVLPRQGSKDAELDTILAPLMARSQSTPDCRSFMIRCSTSITDVSAC